MMNEIKIPMNNRTVVNSQCQMSGPSVKFHFYISHLTINISLCQL